MSAGISGRKCGKSTHAHIIEAIGEAIRRDEQRAEFVGAALARREAFRTRNRAVSFEEMESYALALARGEKPRKPVVTGKKSAKVA